MFYEKPQGAGRTEKEMRVYEALEALGISYVGVDHAPAMTMEDCVAIDKALGAPMCKNLFLCNRQQTEFYLLLMPADTPFKTKDLSAALGVARLSFGSHEQMEALLGVTPGAATVLSLLEDKEGRVRLVVDKEVLAGEYIGCHPMVNTASLRLATADVLEKLLPATGHVPTVVELSRYE